MIGFGKGWSNNQQLFWQSGKVGDSLSLSVPEQKAGKYKLIARYT